jgi:hypothetical protein
VARHEVTAPAATHKGTICIKIGEEDRFIP